MSVKSWPLRKEKRAKNRSWTCKAEEAGVIDLWSNYPCLHNTSCADYKRQDKRAAAMKEIKQSSKGKSEGFIDR